MEVNSVYRYEGYSRYLHEHRCFYVRFYVNRCNCAFRDQIENGDWIVILDVRCQRESYDVVFMFNGAIRSVPYLYLTRSDKE